MSSSTYDRSSYRLVLLCDLVAGAFNLVSGLTSIDSRPTTSVPRSLFQNLKFWAGCGRRSCSCSPDSWCSAGPATGYMSACWSRRSPCSCAFFPLHRSPAMPPRSSWSRDLLGADASEVNPEQAGLGGGVPSWPAPPPSPAACLGRPGRNCDSSSWRAWSVFRHAAWPHLLWSPRRFACGGAGGGIRGGRCPTAGSRSERLCWWRRWRPPSAPRGAAQVLPPVLPWPPPCGCARPGLRARPGRGRAAGSVAGGWAIPLGCAVWSLALMAALLVGPPAGRARRRVRRHHAGSVHAVHPHIGSGVQLAGVAAVGALMAVLASRYETVLHGDALFHAARAQAARPAAPDAQRPVLGMARLTPRRLRGAGAARD